MFQYYWIFFWFLVAFATLGFFNSIATMVILLKNGQPGEALYCIVSAVMTVGFVGWTVDPTPIPTTTTLYIFLVVILWAVILAPATPFLLARS